MATVGLVALAYAVPALAGEVSDREPRSSSLPAVSIVQRFAPGAESPLQAGWLIAPPDLLAGAQSVGSPPVALVGLIGGSDAPLAEESGGGPAMSAPAVTLDLASLDWQWDRSAAVPASDAADGDPAGGYVPVGAPGGFGFFHNGPSINPDGPIEMVPLPAPLAMGLVGLAGVWLLRRLMTRS